MKCHCHHYELTIFWIFFLNCSGTAIEYMAVVNCVCSRDTIGLYAYELYKFGSISSSSVGSKKKREKKKKERE